MVRAPGGQLITRVKTETAAGKLAADVIDHSDRGLMKAIEDLFADYAPPNADDYLPQALVSPKLWPRITPGWSIAYNSELVKNPPKTWWDLTNPGYKPGAIAQVIAPSGGTTWTRIMFERQVLGEDYWMKQAATKPALYPSGAPLSDAMVRGEVEIAPLVYNVIYTKQRDGAPVQTFFPPEGIPIVPIITAVAGESLLALSGGDQLARALRIDKFLRLKRVPITLSVPWGVNVGAVGLLPYLPLPSKLQTRVLPLTRPLPGDDAEAFADRVHSIMQNALTAMTAHRRPLLG